MKTFHKGGIHPAANKLTADLEVREFPVPDELVLPLSQAIGAPSKPVVKAGDEVTAGQMIAEAGGFVSAPIHAPASGKVKKIEKVRTPQGMWQDAIILTVDHTRDVPESQPRSRQEVEALTPKEIVGIVAANGIVGLGGATFPTHVKLSPAEGKVPEIIIINGAECEPYLTCDDRLMRTNAREILEGARLLMRSVSVNRCIVGIEENKPEAIEAMRRAAADFEGIEVTVLKKKYPQGGEKQLIEALTGRAVPLGGLPVDVGCIVDNVATAYAIYQAVFERLPLTRRIVTVTGPDMTGRGNFLVPFGVSIDALLAFAGGLPAGENKVIAGGPMMGRAVSHTDAPSTKGLSGVLVLPAAETLRRAVEPCLRCGKCVDVCPMGLEPYLLARYGLNERWEDAAARNAMACIECGSCSYICPSNRPLLDMIKLDKINIRKR